MKRVNNMLLFIVFSLLWLVPFWIICQKVGISPVLSLAALIPLLGPLIVLAVLAFARWPNLTKREGT